MQSKLLRQYYQIDIINMKHFLILIMLCFALPLAAQNHKYHRVGVSSGTYGHSMQKKECPYCGKMISLGSSHTCVTNEEPRSNAPASDNSYDGPASAIDGDLLGMDLLLHKTGYYPQRVQQQATPEAEERNPEDYPGNMDESDIEREAEWEREQAANAEENAASHNDVAQNPQESNSPHASVSHTKQHKPHHSAFYNILAWTSEHTGTAIFIATLFTLIVCYLWKLAKE